MRPTTDLAKESLFNILNNRVDFDGLQVLELFAGTGNITLEFLSRGAAAVVAVELNPKCIDFFKRTAGELKMENLFAVRGDAFAYLASSTKQYDLIFADPPYDLKQFTEVADAVLGSNLLKKGGLFIIEHPKEFDFSANTRFTENRKYGKVNFSFFE